MATIAKPNETQALPFFKNGVTLDFYQVDMGYVGAALLNTATYTVNTATGTVSNVDRSPVVCALEAIQAKTSVEIIGAARNGTTATNGAFTIAVAALGGAYVTDDYASFGVPGSGTTFANYLQTLVRAAGSHQGVDLSTCSVTAYTF
jgi:hypothetical protein